MLSILRHFVVCFWFVLLAGCAGAGGCGGVCADLGFGITPLAKGFDPKPRIENAASVRITQSGFEFLQANAGALAGGVLGAMGGSSVAAFPIPPRPGRRPGSTTTSVLRAPIRARRHLSARPSST
jgi:hypothetical protein